MKVTNLLIPEKNNRSELRFAFFLKNTCSVFGCEVYFILLTLNKKLK